MQIPARRAQRAVAHRLPSRYQSLTIDTGRASHGADRGGRRRRARRFGHGDDAGFLPIGYRAVDAGRHAGVRARRRRVSYPSATRHLAGLSPPSVHEHGTAGPRAALAPWRGEWSSRRVSRITPVLPTCVRARSTVRVPSPCRGAREAHRPAPLGIRFPPRHYLPALRGSRAGRWPGAAAIDMTRLARRWQSGRRPSDV